jgi:plasmid maintenance system antidote protein VapI
MGIRKITEPHIGNIIKKELRQQGRSITWLASQINCSRENLYKIFRRNWIHTDMLLRISNALDYDFFKVYSDYRKQQSVN